MRKAILMMLLAVMSSGASAENTAPSYFQPWNEVQAYAPTLDWKTGAIPKGAWNGLPKWMSERDADGELNWSRPVAFLSVDLDGDGNDELIVRSGEWFSGGPEFVILKKSSNRWRTIGGFQGGFTISKRLKKGYADIETWSHHPEIYHRLWKFSGGRYKIVRTEEGPWEDRALSLPYVPGGKL